MTRAALVLLACAAPAMAAEPTAPERAEALNERGKALYSDQQDYAGAARSFREAIALSPDARYYYNLCTALEKLGQYRDALDACDAVFEHEPREELATKTGKRAAQIRKEYRAAREAARPDEPPATQPAAPEPAGPAEPAVSEVAARAGQLDYRVGLGADLGVAHNSGVGVPDNAPAGLAVKLHADLLVAPVHHWGVSAYLDLSLFGDKPDVAMSHPLSIFDLGLAAYLHRRVWKSLYVTPLGGVHLTALSQATSEGSDTFGTLGIRLEGSLEWLFGNGRHAVKVTPISLNYYFATAGQIGGSRTDASAYGFDNGGTVWAFTVGYTMRFESSPFPGLNLE